ncbi:unnamed protein product [Mytilus coruscus]|uniref:C2H2-type domain-containing protein n=1 Tax=Mytilus coruscus TaxID=42192 RepID=A0A6J8ABA7_MYTCO|nr:unnamed protein product [Mytilus coruscus]
MSTYNHDINKAVRRSTVCLRCPEETPYQGPRYRVVTHILMNHVEITLVPFYCLLCGYKTTKESQLKAHINFHRKHCEQKAEAIAAQTFEGDTFYFRKSENPYQPKKPDKDFRLMGNSTKGTLREPISCSSGDSTSSLELTTIKTYVPTYGPPDSDAELASSESSSVLPPISLTIEVGKVQDQLRNLTNLMTTMSSQVQGLRSVVRQQGEEIRALKADCRCQGSFTRFGRRKPYSRSSSRSQRPQTPMKKNFHLGLGASIGDIQVPAPTCADDIAVLANSAADAQGILDIKMDEIDTSPYRKIIQQGNLLQLIMDCTSKDINCYSTVYENIETLARNMYY